VKLELLNACQLQAVEKFFLAVLIFLDMLYTVQTIFFNLFFCDKMTCQIEVDERVKKGEKKTYIFFYG
jgi:hypothetical protein